MFRKPTFESIANNATARYCAKLSGITSLNLAKEVKRLNLDTTIFFDGHYFNIERI